MKYGDSHSSHIVFALFITNLHFIKFVVGCGFSPATVLQSYNARLKTQPTLAKLDEAL